MIFKNNSKGFSLLELSIVIAILGILTMGSITITTGLYHMAKTSETKQKLNTIEKAIQAYIIEHKKLPCPAGIKLITSDNNFATEICNINSNAGVKITSENVLVGTIPVKDLNLGTTYIADGWNNKFIYMVSKDFTTTDGNFLKNNVISSNLINNQFSYVIISNGKNRIGGISINRSIENTKKLVEATAGEKKNMYSNITTNNITADKDSKTFDDIIMLRNRDIIVQKLDMYDIGCVVDNSLTTKMNNSDCPNGTYTFSSLSVGTYFKYKERKYSQYINSGDDKQKRCVIECGNYGKFVVFVEEKTITEEEK